MAELEAAGQPYVRATVVRAQRPTSTWAGATAVILPDGTLEGFVGGQCAESSVRAAALQVLESGEPLLLRILPDETEPFPEAPGASTVVNPCLSGGAIELFLEAHVNPRRVVVVGQTPIARAVADLAGSLDLEAVGEAGVPERLDRTTAVILASHGRLEEETIRAALDAGVSFIGLVASTGAAGRCSTFSTSTRTRRPGSTLRSAWTSGPRPPRRSPCRSSPRWSRRSDSTAWPLHPPAEAGAGPAAKAPTAIDPICGMTVVAAPPTLSLDVGGITHWFCSAGCRDQFAEQNTAATGPAPT